MSATTPPQPDPSNTPPPDDARASRRPPRAVKNRSIAPVAVNAARRSRHKSARWLRAAAAWVGLRPEIVVEGVRYRERNPESLRRALTPRGRGWKDYDARFPSGGKPMRIRATAHRPYADLIGPLRTRVYERLARDVRPGDRVLDAHAATGDGAALLAARVGPSGAVVALEADNESVRYARRRYPLANTAFERAGPSALEGELDHAFDAVIAVDIPLRPDPSTDNLASRAPDDDDDDDEGPTRRIAELWRLVRPGGRLALAAVEASDTPPPVLWRPRRPLVSGDLDRLIEEACNIDPADPARVELAEVSGRSLRIITKPEQHPPLPPPPHDPWRTRNDDENDED